MDNNELQAHIKALEEALERGEIEEALSDNEHWIPPRNNGVLLNGVYRYRIKPKPLEF